MFCLIISTEKISAQCTLETQKSSTENGKEFNFSKMSKNVSKIVQTSFDVIFSRFFGQCTLEGREVEKFQRNAKNSQNSRYPNTFPKVSKQVLNLFWGFFSKKKCPVHPGGSKLGTIRKKIENNLKIKKCPKTLLRVTKQVLRWFYRNFLFSAPWRVETWKKFKKLEKLSIFQNA